MDTASQSTILTWLENIPGRKRKRVQQHISPPTSPETLTMDETPRKRKRRPNALYDPDTTPRSQVYSASEHPSTSTSEASSMEGTPPARRQPMSLQLSDSGVECMVLKLDAPPDAAKDLVDTLQDTGRGLHILPQTLESPIKEKIEDLGLDTRKWRYSFTPIGDKDNLPGRIPSFKEVGKILRKAQECQQNNHEEASWNNQVHLRLLDNIFEDFFSGQCDDFNTLSW
ncbi:hypothetical protein BJX63DRAFT_60516 [Aspergillus granulosus]|uniref:PD-(D/E)XK nuclease-like domain-containing protein n=1 Tax=Aspergillus granulosus TaxID=176169 RepID=A0ABR4HVI4_9EURO